MAVPLLSRFARIRGFVALRQSFARFAHLRRQGQAQKLRMAHHLGASLREARGQIKSPAPSRSPDGVRFLSHQPEQAEEAKDQSDRDR